MSKNVIVYVQPKCMQCEFTKKFLNQHKVSFTTVDMSIDASAREYVKDTLGFTSAPVVVIEGEEPFFGFQPDRLESLVS